MKAGKKILAVVPARSGSKGIPDKNLQEIGGLSLIGRAARVLHDRSCQDLDRRILSTDSERYAQEGRRHGLDVPFLRPPELAGDTVGAIETMQHVWQAIEAHDATTYEILLIIEPTCPLRIPSDITDCLDLLISSQAESVVTVSRVDTKFHPAKLLAIREERLGFYLQEGKEVQTRQSLSPFYFRNGACYAVTKQALFERGAIFTSHTLPLLIDRPLANIDDATDLLLARCLDQQPDIR